MEFFKKHAEALKAWYMGLPKWAKVAVPLAGVAGVVLIWQPWKSNGQGTTIETGPLAKSLSGQGLSPLPVLGAYGNVPIGPIVSSSAGGTGTSTTVDPPPVTQTQTQTPQVTTNSQGITGGVYVNPGASAGAKTATPDLSYGGQPDGTQTETSTPTVHTTSIPAGQQIAQQQLARVIPIKTQRSYQTPTTQAARAFGNANLGRVLAAGKIKPQQARAQASFQSITATHQHTSAVLFGLPLTGYQTKATQAAKSYGSAKVARAVVSHRVTVQQARALTMRNHGA